MIFSKIKGFFGKVFSGLFGKQKEFSLGFYGPPNGGKTTLANRLCKDWTGEELGSVSKVPHETRSIQFREKIDLEYNGKKLTMKLIDTPGIATKIDYEDFLKFGMKKNGMNIKLKQKRRVAI